MILGLALIVGEHIFVRRDHERRKAEMAAKGGTRPKNVPLAIAIGVVTITFIFLVQIIFD